MTTPPEWAHHVLWVVIVATSTILGGCVSLIALEFTIYLVKSWRRTFAEQVRDDDDQ